MLGVNDTNLQEDSGLLGLRKFIRGLLELCEEDLGCFGLRTLTRGLLELCEAVGGLRLDVDSFIRPSPTMGRSVSFLAVGRM